jgi:hypothetical protein
MYLFIICQKKIYFSRLSLSKTHANDKKICKESICEKSATKTLKRYSNSCSCQGLSEKLARQRPVAMGEFDT